MQSYFQKGNNEQPEVNFDLESGIFKISGRSMMDKPKEFYNNTLNWLQDSYDYFQDEIQLELDFECFNISSSKMILELLYAFDNMDKAGKKVVVSWNYADDSMLEVGEDFEVMVDLPFEFRKLQIELV